MAGNKDIQHQTTIKPDVFARKQRATTKIFPMVNLLYSMEGTEPPNDTYERVIMAYRDPVMTQMLADCFDYIFKYFPAFRVLGTDRSKTPSLKNAMLKMAGIGITDEERAKVAKRYPPETYTQLNQPGCRIAPDGICPYYINSRGTMGKYRNSQMERLFQLFKDTVMPDFQPVLDAYIKGDGLAMIQAMPSYMTKKMMPYLLKLTLRKKYKITDAPVDELNQAAQWLRDNFLDDADIYDVQQSIMPATRRGKIRQFQQANNLLNLTNAQKAELNKVGQWMKDNLPNDIKIAIANEIKSQNK